MTKISTSKSNGNEPWFFNWFTKRLYVAIVIFFAIVFIISILLKGITRHNSEKEIPSFIGQTIENAKYIADINSLRVEISDSIHNSKMDPGVVIKQNPPIGSKIKKNRRVLLTINSISPQMVPMPSLEGYSLRQAKTELEASQLIIGKLIYVKDIATNNVITQLYRGKRIKPGELIPAESVIDLEVGKNEYDSITEIPNLLGVRYEDMLSVIAESLLIIKKIYFDDDIITHNDTINSIVYKQKPDYVENILVDAGTGIEVYLMKNKKN